MTPLSETTPVPNPTWYEHIRFMFTSKDKACMKQRGVYLDNYDNVERLANMIYQQVETGNMPKGEQEPWPQVQVETFSNWIKTGCPKGIPSLESADTALRTRRFATRIRKEITTLDLTELEVLKKAFSGIMANDPSDPNSYFVQAGYHWFPVPTYCMHHIPGYNPWHRAYLVSFENALRSIPGCENVTLPYWDITTPFPEVLKSPPFDSYTLPKDIFENRYNAGYVTKRYSDDEIQKKLSEYKVTEKINRALTKTDWEDFHGFWSKKVTNNTIIAAHDSGHNSIGPTMSEQEVAAFDPIFWFFHANLDRLFWKWQKGMQATTRDGLLTTINKEEDPTSYKIFTIPEFRQLNPFTDAPPKLDMVSIIDSENSLDVDYQETEKLTTMNFQTKTQLTVPASKKFSVDTDLVNVRVDGIDRLKIPGSFSVYLLKDGERIASTSFFQPVAAENCENCVDNATVHFDFELPLEDVSNGKLEVVVEPVNKSAVGDRFPNELMGNPTIEVHFLMRTE